MPISTPLIALLPAFWVLPLSSTTRNMPLTLDAPASQEAAPHILYLDDDDTLVFLVRRLLEGRASR